MHPTVEDESIAFIIYAFGGPNEAGRESIAFKYLTNQVIQNCIKKLTKYFFLLIPNFKQK